MRGVAEPDTLSRTAGACVERPGVCLILTALCFSFRNRNWSLTHKSTNKMCTSALISVKTALQIFMVQEYTNQKWTYSFLRRPKEMSHITDHGTEVIINLNIWPHPRRKLITGFGASEPGLKYQNINIGVHARQSN